jgi:hypothetical protein
MRRLLLPILLLLALPTAAYASCNYKMSLSSGTDTDARAASKSCSMAGAAGVLTTTCWRSTSDVTLTYNLRLDCTPKGTPSVRVSSITAYGEYPKATLTRQSDRSYQVRVRFGGYSSVAVRRISLGYYC